MESTDHFCTAAGELAAAAMPRTALYARLAEEIAASIRGGAWENGDRIPSVRQFSRERGVSAATVIRAHELLEEQGYIESVPRSGHYVSATWRERRGAIPTAPSANPLTPLDVSEIVFHLLDSIRDNKVVQLGSPFASPELFPLAGLGRTLGLGAKRIDPWRTVEYLADGSLELRQRIAQRYLRHGASVAPDEIIVTSGALEGLNLCLQVVTRPGDTVAIETRTFYGCLHAVETLGLRAFEIPTHSRDGADLTALAQALATTPIRACWFMTTYQNPRSEERRVG